MANRVVPDRQGVINIGKIKENLVTEVELPAPGFEGGSYAVLLRRPREDTAYPVSARHDGSSLVWTVQTADTAIAGTGKLECRWYGDNGEVAKSKTYMVRITDGLPDPTEAPEAWEGYIGQVARNAETAQTAARVATDSAASAAKAAQDGQALYNQVQSDLAEGKLKGEPGPAGPQGEKGPAGEPGAPGLDAPQIDDNTVSTDAPWSSKKIIETLCPPISESGNPVTCEPVAGYPLGVVASWKPTQEGSGDPSPDNIRPIVGRETVTVERCGINLWRWQQDVIFEEDVYPLTIPIDGYPRNLVNVPITIYADYKSGSTTASTRYITLVKDRNVVGAFTLGKPSMVTDVPNKARFYAGHGDGVVGAYYKNIVMFAGTTAPAYTPYRGDTYNLALPQTVYGGTVDAVTGAATRDFAVLTLRGTEKFNTYRTSGYIDCCGFLSAGAPLPNGWYARSKICSHLKNNPTLTDAEGFSAPGYGGNFVIKLNKSRGIETPEQLADWLESQYAAGTPVQIAYRLAKPVPFQATGNAEIMPVPGETNTITTDADSVTVTGRADPIRIIQQLQAAQNTAAVQIAETQQQVVDTTAMAVEYIFEQDSQIFTEEG